MMVMLFVEISLEGGPVWIWLVNSQVEFISSTSLIQLPVEHSGVTYHLLLLTSVLILFPFISFPVAFFFISPVTSCSACLKKIFF